MPPRAQVELGPVSHRRGLQRVGEELGRRGGALHRLGLRQGEEPPWLEVELVQTDASWAGDLPDGQYARLPDGQYARLPDGQYAR
jgi:hypothetical protein